MPDERAAGTSAAPRAIVELSDAECRALLARQRLCVLSLVDGGEPYAVPVFYGYDGEALYLGVAEGRKTKALDASPRVYLVVTEVGPGDEWRSVAVAGSARTVTDPDERRRAIEVLIAHNARVRGARADAHGKEAAPPPRPAGRVLRIEPEAISGRRRG